MIAVISALAAGVIVLTVILTAHFGWGGRVSLLERVALTLMAAGLALAGPERFLGRGVGLGDLMFLTGLALHLLRLYGPAMWRKADSLDGAIDGRVTNRVRVRRPASAPPRQSPSGR